MSPERVEELLRQHAARHPPPGLFAEDDREALRARLAAETTRSPGPRPPHWRLISAAAVAAALVACFIAVRATPRTVPFELQADVAFDRAALFRTVRAAPPVAEAYYVGIRLRRPAFIRLFALHSSGHLEPQALNRAGDLTLLVSDGQAFGAYRLVRAPGTTAVTHVLALATPEPLRNEQVARVCARIQSERMDAVPNGERLIQRLSALLRGEGIAVRVPIDGRAASQQ
jgi:hypothetical protein